MDGEADKNVEGRRVREVLLKGYKMDAQDYHDRPASHRIFNTTNDIYPS